MFRVEGKAPGWGDGMGGDGRGGDGGVRGGGRKMGEFCSVLAAGAYQVSGGRTVVSGFKGFKGLNHLLPFLSSLTPVLGKAAALRRR